MDTQAWIGAQAAAMEALLIEWCSINSGTTHLAGLARMHAALDAAFAQLPCTRSSVDLGPGFGAGFRAVCRPEANKRVFLNGHMDTVYSADDPFQRCERLSQNILRGPGTADMKGGLVILLHTLLALEHTPEGRQLGWEVYIGPDEETGSQGSAPFFAEAAKRHRLGLLFEPAGAGGNLIRSRMGIGIYNAVCRGRAAHAGRGRAEGRNAIVALAGFLTEIDRINDDLAGIRLNVGSISGGGAINVVPDFAQAAINLRASTPALQRELLARIDAAVARVNAREGYRLEFTGKFTRPPKVPGPTEEQLFAVLQDCAKPLGLSLGWVDVAGGSDGNLMSAAGLANLDGLGVLGDHLHSDQEYVELDSLVQRTRLATAFLERIARGEVSLPA